MNRNRICPDCGIEYLSHVDKCADCGAVLLLPEELEAEREKRKRLSEEAVEDEIVLREGDLSWMRELYAVLIDAAIPCAVRFDSNCKQSCRGKCRLVASPGDVERAQERIEDYFMEMHPEIRASRELAGKGRCPACGSPIGIGDRECPDCGLMLVIVEGDPDQEGED